VIRKTDRPRCVRIVAMLILSAMVGGCGFKGPLYLPPKPAEARSSVNHEPIYRSSPDEAIRSSGSLTRILS
jgi:predicted small lipoprotein YifL